MPALQPFNIIKRDDYISATHTVLNFFKSHDLRTNIPRWGCDLKDFVFFLLEIDLSIVVLPLKIRILIENTVTMHTY